MNDFQKELGYFGEVSALIAAKIEELQNGELDLKQKVLNERRRMWEENNHIVRDFDDAVELSLFDSYVSDVERQYLDNQEELRRMTQLSRKPYFGRIDFTEGVGRERTVYIGIYSLVQNEPHKVYVVDWRAPVASMFYTYDLGPAVYEAPNRKKEVDIVLKRQYEIQGGKLLYAYDTNSSMHDKILGEVLSKNTDSKLKVIVGSIQKEQNYAIRCGSSRNCLIYGLAGSGKTSVGMHRLAYLLYRNKDTLTADRILILSNNSIFASYISSILPELGERPVSSRLFSEILSECLGEKQRIEDYYDHLSAVMPDAPDMDRAEQIKKKYSMELLNYLVGYFSDYAFHIPEIRYDQDVIFSEAIYNEKRHWKPEQSFRKKYESVLNLMSKTVEEYFLHNQRRIAQDIIRTSEEFLMKDEIPRLFRRQMRHYIRSAQESFRRLNNTDAKALLIAALSRYYWETDIKVELSFGHDQPEKKKLPYEDALLLALIKTLTGESKSHDDILHIVIDEAQDYNVLQLYLIRCLFPKSTFTILGDVYQAVNTVTTVQNYDRFGDIFGENMERIGLTKCYRSSAEINALAFQLIDSAEHPVKSAFSYFERSVKKPEYIVSKDTVKKIISLLPQLKKYNTAAIITNTVKEAAALYKKLEKAGCPMKMQLITSAEDQLTQQLVIIPMLYAKGLEFDAVILANFVSSAGLDQNLRHKVYLGCTRALHELYFVEQKNLPETLSDCAAYLSFEK